MGEPVAAAGAVDDVEVDAEDVAEVDAEDVAEVDAEDVVEVDAEDVFQDVEADVAGVAESFAVCEVAALNVELALDTLPPLPAKQADSFEAAAVAASPSAVRAVADVGSPFVAEVAAERTGTDCTAGCWWGRRQEEGRSAAVHSRAPYYRRTAASGGA